MPAHPRRHALISFSAPEFTSAAASPEVHHSPVRRPAAARSRPEEAAAVRSRRPAAEHDGPGNDAGSDRAPAPAGTTPAAAAAPARTVAATPARTAAAPAATTPSTDGQDVIRHRALERSGTGERAGRCGIRRNCKPCRQQSRGSECRHVSLHWVPPLFSPRSVEPKISAPIGPIPSEHIDGQHCGGISGE
jgi:hypothetical protein